MTCRKPGSTFPSSLQITLVWGQPPATLEGRAADQRDQEPTQMQQGQVLSVELGRDEPRPRRGLGPMAREPLHQEEPAGPGRQRAEHQPAARCTCWPS